MTILRRLLGTLCRALGHTTNAATGNYPEAAPSDPDPPETAPAQRVTSEEEGDIRLTFSSALIDVWAVENLDRPGEKFVKLADLTGLGSAMRFCSAHARYAGPGEYLLQLPNGDRLAHVRVDTAGLLHVLEWIHPRLLHRHRAAVAA